MNTQLCLKYQIRINGYLKDKKMADEGEVDVLGDFDFKLEYVSDGIILSYACIYFPDPSLICDSKFQLFTRTGKMFNCTAKLSVENGHTQVQLFKKQRKQGRV